MQKTDSANPPYGPLNKVSSCDSKSHQIVSWLLIRSNFGECCTKMWTSKHDSEKTTLGSFTYSSAQVVCCLLGPAGSVWIILTFCFYQVLLVVSPCVRLDGLWCFLVMFYFLWPFCPYSIVLFSPLLQFP